MTREAEQPIDKPRLRGVFHQWAAVVSVIAGVALALRAPTEKGVVAALLYTAALCTLFTVSATYHRVQWRSTTTRARMRRADHASIFILIAGTYTPIAIVALPEQLGTVILLYVWIGAAIGVLQSLLWIHAPKAVVAVLAVALGWVLVAFWEECIAALLVREFVCMAVGGVAFTIGAVMYALKRPNPLPGVLGYHEVFHALTLVGAATHFGAITSMVMRAG